MYVYRHNVGVPCMLYGTYVYVVILFSLLGMNKEIFASANSRVLMILVGAAQIVCTQFRPQYSIT